MVTDVPTKAAPQFDPSREVPDEYDVFCESCGYSLVGLTNDRCPECGAVYEPRQLPFARVPWLHRKRLGKVNAYVRTVLMICFTPGRFADELCRPVRVSAGEARKFRLVTLRLVAVLAALAGLAVIGAIAASVYNASLIISPGATKHRVTDAAFAAAAIVAGVPALYLFLKLATDMPLFIWKGLPSLKAVELSPVHQYACAPLAVAPFFGAVSVYLVYLVEQTAPVDRFAYFMLAVWSMAIVPLWLWGVALAFMTASRRSTPRRIVLLAVYLPVHWIIMFAFTSMLWLLFVQGEKMTAELLHIHTTVFN